MNLKSYMRGLGIGIIVTAILMGIGNNKAEKVTVAEENNATVLSDLKELSQEASSSSSSVKKQQELDDKNDETERIDSAISADEVSANGADKAEASDSSSEKLDKDVAISSSDDKESSSDKKSDDKNKVSTVLPKAGELADDGQAPRDDKKKSDNKDLNVKEDSEKTDSNKSTTGEIIDITIVSGQGSDAIARECERLGLVEEASAFDKFLNSYGYDRKLTTGVHHIPMGSTEAQIAEILTKKGE